MSKTFFLAVQNMSPEQIVAFLNARSDISNWIEGGPGWYLVISSASAQTLGLAFKGFVEKSKFEDVIYMLTQAGQGQSFGFLAKAVWDMQTSEAANQRSQMLTKLVAVAQCLRAKGLTIQLAGARAAFPDKAEPIVESASGPAFSTWVQESLGIALKTEVMVAYLSQTHETMLLTMTPYKGGVELNSDLVDVTDMEADDIAAIMTRSVRARLERGIEVARLAGYKDGFLSANDVGRVEFWSKEPVARSSGFTIPLADAAPPAALVDSLGSTKREQLSS